MGEVADELVGSTLTPTLTLTLTLPLTLTLTLTLAQTLALTKVTTEHGEMRTVLRTHRQQVPPWNHAPRPLLGPQPPAPCACPHHARLHARPPVSSAAPRRSP